MTDQYTVRRYRPEDLAPYLRSYREIFDQDVTPEWFAWKYEDNPYAEETPVWVATTDGEFVGAAGFWPLAVDVGERTVRAIQPCDAMVREGHRRRGIYDEILGTGLDYYRERDAVFCIDFPNELTKGAFEKYGWRMVRRHPTYYRVHGSGAVPDSASMVPGVLVDVAVRGYLGLREAVSRPGTDDFRVEHHEGVRGEVLAAIHRSARPDGFHAVRDATFYDWRFDTPRWEVDTWIASGHAGPLAGVVLATYTHGGRPRRGSRTWFPSGPGTATGPTPRSWTPPSAPGPTATSSPRPPRSCRTACWPTSGSTATTGSPSRAWAN